VGARRRVRRARDRRDRPEGSRPTANGAHIATFSLADPANSVPIGHHFVLLPAGYDNPANVAKRYPVVYLLHGYPFGANDWLTSGDAPGTLSRPWKTGSSSHR
jgi:hypothetical protein